jgi:hypothetical protein
MHSPERLQAWLVAPEGFWRRSAPAQHHRIWPRASDDRGIQFAKAAGLMLEFDADRLMTANLAATRCWKSPKLRLLR